MIRKGLEMPYTYIETNRPISEAARDEAAALVADHGLERAITVAQLEMNHAAKRANQFASAIARQLADHRHDVVRALMEWGKP